MPDPLSDPALETRRQALLEQLAQFGDLRPGSQWILTTKVTYQLGSYTASAALRRPLG